MLAVTVDIEGCTDVYMKNKNQNEIRALFVINTPAQVYTWENVIKDLLNKGHKVKILARDYESTVKLLF